MSLDADYILTYYNLGYVGNTPMQIDEEYLNQKYGGGFLYIDCCTIFWSKPKYTLLLDEIKRLHADQVLERQDCSLWKIVK